MNMKNQSKRYTINVTQANIDLAKTYKVKATRTGNFNPESHCPVALALKKQFKKKVSVGDSDDISIAGRYVNVVGKKKQKQVDNFINNFDRDLHYRCKPFSFEIEREQVN